MRWYKTIQIEINKDEGQNEFDECFQPLEIPSERIIEMDII